MLQLQYSSILWKCAFLAREVLSGMLYCILESLKLRTLLLFIYLCIPLSYQNLGLSIPAYSCCDEHEMVQLQELIYY